MDEKPYKLHDEIKFECASMIVGWKEDAGQLGSGVIDYLINHLKCRLLAEIEPTSFFPLNGVSIEDDIARFPESKLYYCAEKELLLFKSDSPLSEWYNFLNVILDMAQFHCRLSEIYTIGGMISLSPHTAPRELMSVVNSPDMKTVLDRAKLSPTMNYETPDGQRPTLSSYLIWIARERNILGASMWVPVPFYMTNMADLQSWKIIIEFFDKNLNLGLDIGELHQSIITQNEKLEQARINTPEFDEYIKRLEMNQTLTQEENDRLIKDIENIFKSG